MQSFENPSLNALNASHQAWSEGVQNYKATNGGKLGTMNFHVQNIDFCFNEINSMAKQNLSFDESCGEEAKVFLQTLRVYGRDARHFQETKASLVRSIEAALTKFSQAGQDPAMRAVAESFLASVTKEYDRAVSHMIERSVTLSHQATLVLERLSAEKEESKKEYDTLTQTLADIQVEKAQIKQRALEKLRAPYQKGGEIAGQAVTVQGQLKNAIETLKGALTLVGAMGDGGTAIQAGIREVAVDLSAQQ